MTYSRYKTQLENTAPVEREQIEELSDSERKTRGLIALAACAGEPKAAERHLRRTGSAVRVTAATLEKWRDEMPDVYARVADDYGTQLEAQLVVDHRETALKCMDVLDQALERTKDRMQFLSAAEASKVAFDMSRIISGSTRDMLVLTGRPTDISDNRGAVEIVGALAARFPKLFEQLGAGDGTVEGTAEEAEVVPEDLTQEPPPPQEPAPDVQEAF